MPKPKIAGGTPAPPNWPEHCGLAAGSCNMARPECKIG
jgi:hypothetical protein